MKSVRLLRTIFARPALCTSLVIFCFAASISLPILFNGINRSDSSAYNYVWSSQFSELFKSGTAYPRWLPGSFGGLGSSAFYFYPPLFFFADAILNLLTFGEITARVHIAITSFVFLGLSGLTMNRWLRTEASPKVAWVSSLIYMADLYHIFDVYWRGSFAELTIFPLLPLLCLSIRTAARNRGLAGLAITFALLIFGHIPSALLASVTVIPIYGSYEAAKERTARGIAGALIRLGAGLMLGMALAGCYLVPALLLQNHLNAAVLWSSYFEATRWLFLNVSQSPNPPVTLMLFSFAASLAIVSTGVVVSIRRTSDPRGRDAVLWGAVSLLCVALMAGVIPGFWTALPLIGKVQFPWRLMTIAAFATITSAAFAASLMSRRTLVGLLILAAIAAFPGALFLGYQSITEIRAATSYWATNQSRLDVDLPDAFEYLPVGFPGSADEYGLWHPLTLPKPPSAVCQHAARLCSATQLDARGGLQVHVDADVPTSVTVGRFFFPSWRVETADGTLVPIQPAPPYQLIQFVTPAGSHTVRLFVGRLPEEDWGLAISALAAGILLMLGVVRTGFWSKALARHLS